MSRNRVPTAFPVVANGLDSIADEGMMLRDWFAGQALVGMLASMQKIPKDCSEEQMGSDYAGVSYVIADAMMKEREK